MLDGGLHHPVNIILAQMPLPLHEKHDKMSKNFVLVHDLVGCFVSSVFRRHDHLLFSLFGYSMMSTVHPSDELTIKTNNNRQQEQQQEEGNIVHFPHGCMYPKIFLSHLETHFFFLLKFFFFIY